MLVGRPRDMPWDCIAERPRPFAEPGVVEAVLYSLLAKRLPAEQLERLRFDDMLCIPDSWVDEAWRCSDLSASIPLVPDGEERQATHAVVLVKSAAMDVADAGVVLRQEAALLEREFHRRRVFGAPFYPPSITTIVVAGRGRQRPNTVPATPVKRNAVRCGPNAVSFVPS